MSEILPHLFQVGDWQADANQNLMWHGSRKIHLEPKAMAILQYLVMHANNVVSREVLFAEFWKNQVVTEDALNRAMWNIRRSLGDTPNNPQYIATIRNRGYKLIAPTTILEDPRVKEHQASVLKNIEKNLSSKNAAVDKLKLKPKQAQVKSTTKESSFFDRYPLKLWQTYSTIVLVPLILVGLFSTVFDTQEKSDSSQRKLSRLTYSQEQNVMPVVSYNGESLVYVARTKGKPNQLKLLNKTNNQTYWLGNKKHNYSYPTFNKDNVSLAVISDQVNKSELAIINVNSNDIQSIITLKQTSHGLSWHPEQNLLAYTQAHPETGRPSIFIVHTELKQPQLLTHSGTGIKDQLPKFSPDGNRIAFIRHFAYREQALFVVDLQGEMQRISANFSQILSYVWLNDKELLLSLAKGTSRLSLTGKLTVESINSIENNSFSTLDMHFIARNEQLIFSQSKQSTQVVNYPLKDANLGHNLTISQANDTEGDVSQNGRNLAFVSNRTGQSEIWLLQGNNLSHIESSIADYIYDLRWSPDSTKLVATLKVKGEYYLFNYQIDTNQHSRIALGQSPINIADWQTNQLILFTQRQKDSWYLFQYDTELQQKKKLSDLNIYQARLTPDKRQIVYTSHKAAGIWLWDRNTVPNLIANSTQYDLPRNWFVDDEFLYYLSSFENINQSELWQLDLTKGEQHRVGIYPMLELSSRSKKRIYNFTASKISQLNGDIWSVDLQP
ncbi:winged helix-turn-helix domain-containing protein [Colwellia psychrerythraea]|uniref:Transcriptional regulator, CadC n=1 Tax=Colwellia psychrerythraea TaxID=28229 RepID=A0A099KMR6_COLPS|nr:winged helix-turn-helix domain-containing protein [Colwellia psychrerythraea]KGJ91202.1 transcriptional regulator, CadC [Colwellia psychrerythraea]